MRKDLEIDNSRMKPEENVKKKNVKKSWILSLSKELKKKSKKLNHFNYKEKFKVLNISND